MKRLAVIFLPTVETQIRDQVRFIAEHSVSNALAWEDRPRQAIDRIADLPGHAADEDATDRIGTKVQKYVFEGTYLVH